MALILKWSFSGYDFPYEDSPPPGASGDWNKEEKLVLHDPLVANVTVITSWGFKSRTRTITGTCGRITRDTMNTKWGDGEVGSLVDAEGRKVTCRITSAAFVTLRPIDVDLNSVPGNARYDYTISFMEQ